MPAFKVKEELGNVGGARRKPAPTPRLNQGLDTRAFQKYLGALPSGQGPSITNIPGEIGPETYYMGPGTQGAGGAAIPMSLEESYGQMWGGGGAMGGRGRDVSGGPEGGIGRGFPDIDPEQGRAMFANEVFKEIGMNPFEFDPIIEADRSIQVDIPRFFQHIFGGEVDPRNMTPEDRQYWIKSLADLKKERIMEMEAKRARGMEQFKVMMEMFDREARPSPVKMGAGRIYLPGRGGTRGEVLGGSTQQTAIGKITALYSKLTKNGQEEMTPEGLEAYKTLAKSWGYDIDPDTLQPIEAGGGAMGTSGAGRSATIQEASDKLANDYPPAQYKGKTITAHKMGGIMFRSDGTQWVPLQ